MKAELMRVSEVARWLGVSTKRVYAMIQEGKLKALRYSPRQTRIVRASVEEFLRVVARISDETLGLGIEERREIEREELAKWLRS